MGSKDEMVALIEENFARRTDVSSPTFELIQFLFACVCFHYTHIDTHIHKTTNFGHHQFLSLQVEQNILTSFLLPDIPGRARPTLPTLQEYLRMPC